LRSGAGEKEQRGPEEIAIERAGRKREGNEMSLWNCRMRMNSVRWKELERNGMEWNINGLDWTGLDWKSWEAAAAAELIRILSQDKCTPFTTISRVVYQ
jgi:hypothetical protein